MTILCPVDFSAGSAAVVALAAALAAGAGSELRLLHVYELPETGAATVPADCTALLAGLQAAAGAAGATHVSAGVLRGEAAPTIVAEATRRHADLIVLGAHGRTGLSRFLMGNTAEAVLRTAACATLLVREPANS